MTQILGRKSFAVLLVNFTDTATNPFSLAQAEDAWDRIRKYWQYDSYDKVNLNGSQVFDWQTYPSTRAAFTAAHADATGAHRGPMIASVKSKLGVDTTSSTLHHHLPRGGRRRVDPAETGRSSNPRSWPPAPSATR